MFRVRFRVRVHIRVRVKVRARVRVRIRVITSHPTLRKEFTTAYARVVLMYPVAQSDSYEVDLY